jgi:penicillin G amidase
MRRMTPSPAEPGSARARWRAWILVALAVVAALAGAGAWWLHRELAASLPRLDGRVVVNGVAGRVLVKRDRLGIPTIQGEQRADVAWATGFVHAQDRFFAMDLSRRFAAGELSELFGRVALEADRSLRVHAFRSVARAVIDREPPRERALVAAYAAGVNAGLAALPVKPWEYLVLGTSPRPWKPEDTVLVLCSMFVNLQAGVRGSIAERDRALLEDRLAPELAAFLLTPGDEWDAPMAGPATVVPPVPGPNAVNLRASAEQAPRLPADEATSTAPPVPGSNNWAVAASRTRDGRAILANDMHLSLGVPPIWYRASFEWAEDGVRRRVTGVSLPGTPAMVVGSNEHVAWGFTNVEGDVMDLVQVDTAAPGSDVYRTPGGSRRFDRRTERIHVKGAPDETITVVSTIWGPIVDQDHRGNPLALHWTAHDPEALNLQLVEMERASGVEEAIKVGHAAGIPAQNLSIADASGRVAWTVAGRLPRRVGFDGQRPTSWADGTRRWDGWIADAEYPVVLDPPSGRIWTANNRVVDRPALDVVGLGHYDRGARARQIRDRLMALDKASERDLLAIQLDDRALFLERWRQLLLKVLTPDAVAGHPQRAELRRAAADGWTGRASVDSAGYTAVKRFRAASARFVIEPLVGPARRADGRFVPLPPVINAVVWRVYDGVVWRILEERPIHLLDKAYRSWDDLLLAAADATVESLTSGGGTIAASRWGDATRRIRHPFSRSLPWLSRWLDMPGVRLPGDVDMPRVRDNIGDEAFGASERMVVSPGHERDGILHMPGGQSGHPLSPHYGDGQAAWVNGEATPFLPGPTVHTLVLEPRSRAPVASVNSDSPSS